MLGFGALASRAFNSLIEKPLLGPQWGDTGGIGHKKRKERKESIKKSQRAEMQEHLEALFAEPVYEELKEEIKEYIKPSQGFSVYSIDYRKLTKDIELVQRIITKAREIQQEQEDEAILLMLL